MESFLKTADKLVRYISASILIVMIVAIFGQVLNRNIFHLPIPWFEELGRYCMIMSTMIGAEMGFRDGTQLSVTLFTSRLNEKVRRRIRWFARGVVILYSCFFSVISWHMVIAQKASPLTTAALKVQLWKVYTIIPLGFILIAFMSILTFIIDLRKELMMKHGGVKA